MALQAPVDVASHDVVPAKKQQGVRGPLPCLPPAMPAPCRTTAGAQETRYIKPGVFMGGPGIRVSGFRVSGFQGFGVSGLRASRLSLEFQGFRVSGLQVLIPTLPV